MVSHSFGAVATPVVGCAAGAEHLHRHQAYHLSKGIDPTILLDTWFGWDLNDT